MQISYMYVLHFLLAIPKLQFLNLTSCKLKTLIFCHVFVGLVATDSRKFDAGFVDPWCSFPAVVDNNWLLWSELSRYMYFRLYYVMNNTLQKDFIGVHQNEWHGCCSCSCCDVFCAKLQYRWTANNMHLLSMVQT